MEYAVNLSLSRFDVQIHSTSKSCLACAGIRIVAVILTAGNGKYAIFKVPIQRLDNFRFSLCGSDATKRRIKCTWC